MKKILPDKWSWKTLDDLKAEGKSIVSGPFGSNIGKKFFVDEGIPVIRGNNLTTDMTRFIDDGFVYVTDEKANELSNCQAIHEDIIITAAGSLGQVGIIPSGSKYPKYIISNKQLRARLNKEHTSPLFAFYWLSSKAMVSYIQLQNTGSSVPLINLSIIKAIPVPCPPLKEQKAIAHILGSLDDKIENNRKMNETMEAMAQAMFKSWFVDFDPVRQKLDGQKPYGMDGSTDALFPESFEDSPLGKIPKGWEVKTIEEVAEKVGMGPFGSSIKVSTFVSEGVPVISGQHLRSTMLDDSEYNFVTLEHADKLKNTNVFKGDVIFTHAGSIGQAAYIPESSQYERYVLSQRQFYMRCDLSQVSPYFIVYYFKSPEGQHRLLANTSSTGVPSISRPVSYLRTIKLVVPPKSLNDAFDSMVSSLHFKMSNNIKESKTLSEIRDTLLPKLISGQIRIKDAEKFVEGLDA